MLSYALFLIWKSKVTRVALLVASSAASQPGAEDLSPLREEQGRATAASATAASSTTASSTTASSGLSSFAASLVSTEVAFSVPAPGV